MSFFIDGLSKGGLLQRVGEGERDKDGEQRKETFVMATGLVMTHHKTTLWNM